MAASLYWVAQGELKPGERLLWTGYCRSRLGKQGESGSPEWGLFVGGFFGLFGGVVLSDLIDLGVPLLVVLTAPLGVFLGYRFYPQTSAYRKSRTIYALTDRRVFVLRDLFRGQETKSLPLEFITSIEWKGGEPIQTRPVGAIPATDRGTITFFAAIMRQPGVNAPYLQFFMTSDAQRGAGLVSEAREKLVAGDA